MKNITFYQKTLQYSFYLIEVIPMYIDKIIFKHNKELILIISLKNLKNCILFLKNHWNSKFKLLIDITAVDFLKNKEKKRFELNYFLLSLNLNYRLRLKVYIDEFLPVPSITNIYKGANWFERETWDMFGIFFSNHPDLRRILTDYGFEGFPFRKDFPQTGYFELRYDEEKKHVLYESIEMTQEFRSFDFVSPWLQVK